MANANEIFRILIVDDDAVTRALLQDHLTSGRHEVIAVDCAASAMAILESLPVHIVVADWLMPDISGLDLLRWVRGHATLAKPHFVMLTANTGQEQLVEAFTAGVDDFLPKPFNEVELMARLKAWTRLVALQNEANRLTKELRTANDMLVEIASSDDLTGLANRRSAMKQLERCIQLASRHGHPLTCALIDVDHFKRFNDLHGHAAGDQVLRHFAGILSRSIRSTDICSRIGGDEFLVILPHTSLEASFSWANHFNANLTNTPLHYKQQTLTIQTSIGLAPWIDPMTADEILESADQVLYKAKGSGRGIVHAQVSCGATESVSAGLSAQ